MERREKYEKCGELLMQDRPPICGLEAQTLVSRLYFVLYKIREALKEPGSVAQAYRRLPEGTASLATVRSHVSRMRGLWDVEVVGDDNDVEIWKVKDD